MSSVLQPVPGRVWPQLPCELAEHIATSLSHNDVPCSLCLVNKAAAEQFRGPQHTKVLLSQPTPAHEFAWRWGDPGATRALTYEQRIQLLCLTAASGSIPNLEVALASAGCLPTGKVLGAAAAAGQLHMCEWLLERGCPYDGALEAAAQAGQRDACMWLIERNIVKVCESAYSSAARGGHVGLMEELMQLHQFQPLHALSRYSTLPSDVAAGCDLPTLQRLHREWQLGAPADGEDQQQQQNVAASVQVRRSWLIGAAAGSSTPDWREKVEWLEGQGYPRTLSAEAAEAAAGRPDAVDRLEWLRQRGYPLPPTATLGAARAGNLGALQYLYDSGAGLSRAAETAAANGHLDVVAWLVETLGLDEAVDGEWRGLFRAAAASGSIELLAWLHGRGCPWGERTFAEAASAGNEAALEWLVEQGCPIGANGLPFMNACYNNDLATLRCLARLGCPWGPVGRVFKGAYTGFFTLTESSFILVSSLAQLPTLRALLSSGCPVDWKAAEATVLNQQRNGWPERRRADHAEVLALLAEERERRQGVAREGRFGFFDAVYDLLRRTAAVWKRRAD